MCGGLKTAAEGGRTGVAETPALGSCIELDDVSDENESDLVAIGVWGTARGELVALNVPDCSCRAKQFFTSTCLPSITGGFDLWRDMTLSTELGSRNTT